MTIITVTSPSGRLSSSQRRLLAETLTDAVLIPEVGQAVAGARVGFQVHFVERPPEQWAIGGRLLSEQSPPPDVMTVDVCVMDAAWPAPMRGQVIVNVLQRLAEACGLPRAAPGWWVNFRVIDEGSWGSRGRVLSILDLLESGAFTPARIALIREAIGGRAAAGPAPGETRP